MMDGDVAKKNSKTRLGKGPEPYEPTAKQFHRRSHQLKKGNPNDVTVPEIVAYPHLWAKYAPRLPGLMDKLYKMAEEDDKWALSFILERHVPDKPALHYTLPPIKSRLDAQNALQQIACDLANGDLPIENADALAKHVQGIAKDSPVHYTVAEFQTPQDAWLELGKLTHAITTGKITPEDASIIRLHLMAYLQTAEVGLFEPRLRLAESVSVSAINTIEKPNIPSKWAEKPKQLKK